MRGSNFPRESDFPLALDMMKWAEVRYGFITQDLRIKTCLDVVRGLVLTLENIVNKTNVKLGWVIVNTAYALMPVWFLVLEV